MTILIEGLDRRHVADLFRADGRGVIRAQGRILPLLALLFAPFHAAAWPVAGWLARIEGAPDGEA